jgi:hypothetical protein
VPQITKQNCKIFHKTYSNSQPLNSDELGLLLISSPNTESCPSSFLVFEGPQNAIGTIKTSGIWHHYTWRWRCNNVHSVQYSTDTDTKSCDTSTYKWPHCRRIISNTEWLTSEGTVGVKKKHHYCHQVLMSPWYNATQCTGDDMSTHYCDSKESLVDMTGVCAWEVLHTVVMNNHNCCWMHWVKPQMVYMQLLQAWMKWKLKKK